MEDLTEKIRERGFSVPRNYGGHNLAIFPLSPETREFESLPGNQIVVKLVDYDDETSSCEVFALREYAEFQKAKGQTPTFVTSGVLKRTALPYNIGNCHAQSSWTGTGGYRPVAGEDRGKAGNARQGLQEHPEF